MSESDTSDIILPIDVAIIGRDLLWAVEVLNGVNARHRDAWSRDFAGIAVALEQLVADHPTVIVAGPLGVEGVLAMYDTLREERPTWRFVFVLGEDEQELAAQVRERTGAEPLVAADLTTTLDRIDVELEYCRAVDAETRLIETTRAAAVDAGLTGKASQLVLVTSASGGAGCTTTAVNLAAALAAASARSVTFVDGNGFKGDAAFLLRVSTPAIPTAPAAKIDANTVARITKVHTPTGLRVIVPPPDGDRLATPSAEELLEILVALDPRSDIVVLDAPPELLHEAGLDAYADVLLVVTSTRMASLKNALLVAEGLDHGPDAQVVVNSPTSHLPDLDRATIEAVVGLPLAALLPYDADIARGSVSHEPEVLARSRSRYARAMAQLAHHLLDTVLVRYE